MAQQIEIIPVAQLHAAKTNPRVHNADQIGRIARSIEKFGFNGAILIDENNEIIAGHGRLEGAKRAGLTELPCIRKVGLTEQEKRAYRIADNKIAEQAGWNRGLLAGEFRLLIEAEFELELTGFDLPEIDLVVSQVEEGSPRGQDDEDRLPDSAEGPAVTQTGDTWLLGRHRLYCGDSRERASFDQALGKGQAHALFADAPYNVDISDVVGRGRVRHRQFAMASGEMPRGEFEAFLSKCFGHAADCLVPGAVAFVMMDWRHIGEVLQAGNAAFAELKNLCVWNKVNAGMGSFYRSQHELVFVWKSKGGDSINNVRLGRYGRNRSNVWTYAGANGFRAGRTEDLSVHPTVKPVALVADAIRDVTHRGHVVLDPFAGSGTTIMACEKTGRSARAIEIDPRYCDAALRRFEQQTGEAPILAETGQTFDQVRQVRRIDGKFSSEQCDQETDHGVA